MTQRDYLVIDLEATCDRTGFPRELMETIELGAVLVSAETLTPIEEFQSFIRPVQRPQLTAFCMELTSITQAMVDEAPLFPEVMASLARFLDGRQPLFCSWGDYDRNQLRQDAALHQVALPLGHDHLNLKAAFSARQGTRKRFGMKGALRRVGVALDGTHHRGIDDARNIAKLLPWCVARPAGLSD